jgi:hypothetical protein
MTKVEINPGICKFTAVVTADSEVGCDSKCPSVLKMFEALGENIDAFQACFCKSGQGPVYKAANSCHAACPVPSGLIKCIEAECGLALPSDADIKFINE